MPNPDAPEQDPVPKSKTSPEASSLSAWLRSRAGLIILVVLAAIVGLRLMSSWIKWMLIAMVGAAIYFLVKGALKRLADPSND